MEIGDEGLEYVCGVEMDLAEFCLGLTSDNLDPEEIPRFVFAVSDRALMAYKHSQGL